MGECKAHFNNPKEKLTIKSWYSPIRGNAPQGAFLRIFTVAFLLFLAPAGQSSNPI